MRDDRYEEVVKKRNEITVLCRKIHDLRQHIIYERIPNTRKKELYFEAIGYAQQVGMLKEQIERIRHE